MAKSYEQRKKEKEEKIARHKAAAKKEKTKKTITWVSIIGGSVLVLGVLLVSATRAPEDMQGERHESQGEVHIEQGEEPPEDYNTNPPTSGWHYGGTLSPGFYETSQEFGLILHSLEHGAVAVYYNPENIDDSEIEQLREWYEGHRQDNRMVVVPLEDMDTSYALTAWTWIDKFDEYNEERIERFISDHMDKWGPERGAAF